MVNIAGLNKSEVLARLYNNSKVIGLGVFQAKEGNMSNKEALELLENSHTKYFDYIHGRSMKIDLTSDIEFEEFLYDRDNGLGKAQEVIDVLRKEKVVFMFMKISEKVQAGKNLLLEAMTELVKLQEYVQKYESFGNDKEVVDMANALIKILGGIVNFEGEANKGK